MSEEVIVLKTFNNEIEAGMAQQVLQEAGMTAFVFKDDAGGMEPQLQLTNGVRLVVNRADQQRAHKMLRTNVFLKG
jgi:putative signal transducing protein